MTLPSKYNQATVDTIKNQISSLFPPWVRYAKIPLPLDGFDPVLDLPFVVEELNVVLSNLKLRASPGLDNIDYKIISNLPDSARSFLLKLYNKIFTDQTISLEWSQYLVFFIPKDDEALKFRPILLASCLFKIMERLIVNRLNWFVEYKEILPRSQFSFRRNKSCIDNLAILQSEILLVFKKDRALPAAFLDIKSAYDNVLPNILISKLIDLGVSPNVTAFIQNATYSRQVHCRFENIDEIIFISKGLPQRSVLSPLLYNIYVSEIESKCVGDCKIIQFADDIAIFCASRNLRQDINQLNLSLGMVSEELFLLGLDLSTEKTKFCLFKRGSKNCTERNLQLFLNSGVIRPSPRVKFLGILFSPNLSWGAHVDNLWHKYQCPLKILSCLTHTWWGADPQLLKIIYNALVRSRLDYDYFILKSL